MYTFIHSPADFFSRVLFKYGLFTIVFMLPVSLVAQQYNPYVSNGSISPAPMAFVQDNGSALFTIEFGNTGSSALPYVVGQETVVSISLLRGVPNPSIPNNGVSGSIQSYFTWTYDVFGNSLIGRQNQPIPANSMGTIIVDYLVTSNSTMAAPTNGFNVNLNPSPLTSSSNNLSDDNTSSFSYTRAIALGVELQKFSGSKMPDHNRLAWTSLSEENNDHFNLYHGVKIDKLTKIAEIPSQSINGNSAEQIIYSFNHLERENGNNFYRLSSVDFDGNEEYYNAINIFLREESGLRVWPNPAKDVLIIDYQNGSLDMVEFTLTGMEGKTVFKKRIVFENGTYTERIPLSSFAKGVYLLKITDFEGYTYSQKVVKK
jgi:hypothetical protein